MNTQSLAISGLLTLEMHALNNEGAEGNTMMTRMVDIVDEKGAKHTVNAVSGDMFKHMQTGHLIEEARSAKLPLCAGCEKFDANRICFDEAFKAGFKDGARDSDILSGALQTCAVDDMQGILITSKIGGKERSIARKSCVEFGWAVGKPGAVSTEAYFHAKYVPEGRAQGSGSSDNLGQNIFHRPASSGLYAITLGVDLFRVGRNDITLEPALEDGQAEMRRAALLRSILSTFLKPTGAHRNTQNPHVVDFSGVVAASSSSLPAPAVSALRDDYLDQIDRLAAVLNQIEAGAVTNRRFSGLAGFAETMAELLGPAVARASA